MVFVGSSQDDIRAFPEGVRKDVGRQLYRLQAGLDPINWKPMKNIGTGVRKIRVKHREIYRVIYVLQIKDQIHVLHAFQKKDQKARQSDINLAKQRLQEIRP